MTAVFVKLRYAAAPVEALTLLAIRMGSALPLFLWLLWMARERGAGRLPAKDIGRILLLGFTGYYLASLLDFFGLETVTAGLERLIRSPGGAADAAANGVAVWRADGADLDRAADLLDGAGDRASRRGDQAAA